MANAKFEHMTVNVSVVLGVFATIAVIVVGSWVNANDTDLTEAKKVNLENAIQIASNTAMITANATVIERNQGLVEAAAGDANANKETLIRIETILEERLPAHPH